jgi:hypothetical protein
MLENAVPITKVHGLFHVIDVHIGEHGTDVFGKAERR